ncbi:MAG: chloride channel protein [Gammaproteobacteria bacterium]|nr:chloride channel protein [Gammaproteobacteria bacterium]
MRKSAGRTRPQASLRQRGAVAITAILVGIVASAGTILFREGFAALQALLFGSALSEGIEVARAAPNWLVLTAPAAGGLVAGLLAWYFLPSRRAQGVPEVIERSNTRPTRLNLRTGAVAAAASTVAIGTGASVGREGPMVHLGATVGAWIAQQLRLSADAIRQMLACGAAAGVAASFNAPIAGAIFAAEVILGRYTIYAFAPLVIASVSGTIVSRLYFGDLQEFSLPILGIESYAEIPSFIALGLVCAGLALAFIRGTTLLERAWDRSRVPPMLRPALGGLALGLIATWRPEVLGVGYESTSLALAGEFTVAAALALLAAKLLATFVCLGSGIAGGIFSPTLMLGALLGCAWGGVMGLALPGISSSASAYAVVGMGAVAAAALGAPLSTTLIVFEMTGNYPVTLAVLLASVVSSVVVNELWGYSFFTWQLAKRGVHARWTRADVLLNEVPVSTVAAAEAPIVAASTDAREWLQGDARLGLVVDEHGQLLGHVTRSGVARTLWRPDATPDLTVKDAVEAAPTLTPDTRLVVALEMLKQEDTQAMVLIDADRRPFAYLRREDIIRRYHEIIDEAYLQDARG